MFQPILPIFEVQITVRNSIPPSVHEVFLMSIKKATMAF